MELSSSIFRKMARTGDTVRAVGHRSNAARIAFESSDGTVNHVIFPMYGKRSPDWKLLMPPTPDGMMKQDRARGLRNG